jgi:hypothetical protein
LFFISQMRKPCMTKVVAVEEAVLTREILPREIPLNKLCPPVVYTANPTYLLSVSGIVDSGERAAFKKLLPHIKEKLFLSEMEIMEFVKNELPNLSEGRAVGLLRSITSEGGLAVREVKIRKEELPGYFKGVMCIEAPKKPDNKTSQLKFHGIDKMFWPSIERYSMQMVKPFLENTADTNEMLSSQMKELKKRGFDSELAEKCVKRGMFADDVERFNIDSLTARRLVQNYSNWRKQVTDIFEVGDSYNLDCKKHPSIFAVASVENLKANLEKCSKMGLDPEKDGLMAVIIHPKEEFDKEIRKRKEKQKA